MANLIPTHFPKSSNALVTYAFTDFITNQGYVLLYAGKTANNTILSTQQFYSDVNGTNTPGGNNGANDIDFDILINRQIVVEGKCTVVVPLLHHVDSTPGAADTTITVSLRKWDGTTETEVASCTITATQPNTPVSANTLIGWVWSGDFTVSKTVYKRGETLRLSIATAAPGAASREIIVCHDPIDRDIVDVGSWIASGTITQPDTSTLKLILPLKLEI